MAKIKIRSAYSGAVHAYHPEPTEPTRVKQEFKKEVNINEIVARMRRGISPPPWMTSSTPRYGDFSNMPASFQEAFAIVEKGREAFMGLPLDMRRELDHDPRNLDTAPRELFERYGLVKKSADAESPTGDSGAVDAPVGQGDRDLPVKRQLGANKAAQKAATDAE